jgi:hypothetical protein
VAGSEFTQQLFAGVTEMNVLLDQELADHQTRLRDGLRDYDNHQVEEERMANELSERFHLDRQAREENRARWLDLNYQDLQAINNLLDRPQTTIEEARVLLSQAMISCSKVRSLAMGDDR